MVEGGDTVIVIEHNLDVIKTADYITDLGPEGGDRGGMVIAKGMPEDIAKEKKSYTGAYIKEILERNKSQVTTKTEAKTTKEKNKVTEKVVKPKAVKTKIAKTTKTIKATKATKTKAKK